MCRRNSKLRRGRKRVRPRLRAARGTASVLRAWFQLPPTNWKRLSCAARSANWSRPAWPAAAKQRRGSRSCEVRTRWVGTILARVGQGRNIRSATDRKVADLSSGAQRGISVLAGADQHQVPRFARDDNRDQTLTAVNVISFAELFVASFHSANSVA